MHLTLQDYYPVKSMDCQDASAKYHNSIEFVNHVFWHGTLPYLHTQSTAQHYLHLYDKC